MNLKLIKTSIGILLIILAVAYQFFNPESKHKQADKQNFPSAPSIESQTALLDKIRQAKDDTNARFWLTIDAKVVKMLKDDRKGAQHQRFLISPSQDITLLVAHNIDVADYVPLSVGDHVKIKGRYEWNNRGGVVHWTHRNERAGKEGGWIYYKGKYYK